VRSGAHWSHREVRSEVQKEVQREEQSSTRLRCKRIQALLALLGFLGIVAQPVVFRFRLQQGDLWVIGATAT
jgi:hypothetical protein